MRFESPKRLWKIHLDLLLLSNDNGYRRTPSHPGNFNHAEEFSIHCPHPRMHTDVSSYPPFESPVRRPRSQGIEPHPSLVSRSQSGKRLSGVDSYPNETYGPSIYIFELNTGIIHWV